MSTIRFVTNNLSERSGGPTWVVINLAKQLSILGHKVSIHSFGNSFQDQPQLLELEQSLIQYDIELNCNFSNRLNSFGWENIFLLIRIFRTFSREDKILLNYIYSFPIIIFAFIPLPPKKIFLMPHGSMQNSEFHYFTFLKWIYASLLYFSPNFRNFHFVFSSNKEKNDFLISRNIDYSVIGFGVDEIRNLRVKDFDKVSSKTLIFVGRIHPIKNLDSLVEAVSLLISSNVDLYLLVVGDGLIKDVERLQLMIARYSLEHKVFLKGWLTGMDKDCIFQSADLLVLPSFSENFGVVVLEAAANGIPSVLAPNVGIAQMAQFEGGAIIAKSESAHDLAEAIVKSLSQLEQMSKCALKFAAKNSWQRIGVLWAELLAKN